MSISTIFRRFRGKLGNRPDSTESKIRVHKQRLLRDISRLNGELRLAERQLKKLGQEAHRLQPTRGSRESQDSLERVRTLTARVSRLRAARSFLQRRADLLDDIALQLTIAEAAESASGVLRGVIQPNPDLEQLLTEEEMVFRQWRAQGDQLLAEMQMPLASNHGEMQADAVHSERHSGQRPRSPHILEDP